MRNLRLLYCKHHKTNIREDIKYLLFDANSTTQTNEKYYAVTDSKIYTCSAEDGVSEVMLELPANIVSAEYLALECEICLATDVGEVLIVNPETLAQNEGTFCDVGIELMAWSPDQEVVVFITKEHSVVVMTCTYDVIAEHALVDEVDASGQFVNVGWGKKETQFHGTEGKQAAKQRIQFKAPENVKDLPQNVEVSWRADGAYFTVSYVSEHVGRMFKVFDKEGKLCFVSERLNDLEPVIAWRPSGNWIAVPQILPNKSTIALFEKNGLRHRELVLSFDLKIEPIVNLKWSSDSDILTVHTRHTVENWEKIYFYTIGNYHWYLKHTLNFPQSERIAFFVWDTRFGEEKTMHLMLANGKYFQYCWQFGIDKYHDSGTVGVIDGKKLLLSNFSKSVVPPPMCNEELTIEHNINACVFIGCNEFCLYDEHRNLHFFQSQEEGYERIFTLTPSVCDYLPLYQLRVIPEIGPNYDQLIAAQPTPEMGTNILLISLNYTEDKDHYAYRTLHALRLPEIVCALSVGDSLLSEAYAQTLNGKIYHIVSKPNETLTQELMPNLRFEEIAGELEWYGTKNYEKTGLIALMSKHRRLYVDNLKVAEDVTSFARTGNYLAYTKLCTLHFYHLVTQRQVSERKIERGGKLVTINANDARTVLQMPRGNLEAINPRVLALDIVGNLLDNCRYDLAMDMLRKQRINLNIICDHNMKSFVKHIDNFLRLIKNPSWINLFLSDLQNEDFTKTMYASNYAKDSQEYPDGFSIDNKVEYLCSAMCRSMQAKQNDSFRLPIITSYVKIGQLETALQLIWQQKQQESAAAADAGAGESHTNAADCLRYLLYLVDVNELYNVALGTYDFGLVLFVAQKSQKDPKEFLPFLNELKSLELNYRHYKIDEHLKRHERALNHIAKCGEEKFEEALEFIKKHSLYKKALDCYKQEPECLKQICLAFGDYLRAKGCLENASLMYERGGNYAQALLSAKNVLDWQRVLVLAKRDNLELASVALSLVPSLQEHGKYAESFELLKTYDDDFANALDSLIKGKLFLMAIYEARMHRGDEFKYETQVKDGLLAYCGILESTLSADRELFVSYHQRLLVVREKHAKAALGVYDDDTQVDCDESDLISETSSIRSSQYTASSRGTGKTFRSAKNRRKHERKLLSLKPGNPFEDIALIDALYNHIMKLQNQQQHIHDTCKALLELEQDKLASKIQHEYKKIVKLIEDSLDEIWIPEMLQTTQFLTGPNIDYTLLQKEQRYAMIEPQKRFKPQLNFNEWELEVLK